MAFRGPVSSKGIWSTIPPGNLGDAYFQGVANAGYPAGYTYSPTNSRTTDIYGDRWVMNFWFRIDGDLRAVYGYTTYNGVGVSYEQMLVSTFAGKRILNSSGTTAGTNYIESGLNIEFEGSNTTNHNIKITYTPTFVPGQVILSNLTFTANKWFNLTLAYNVTHSGVNNRFVARLISQDGTVDTTKYSNLTYGTSASATGYRTFALDKIHWAGLFQHLPGDDGIDYQNVLTKPSYGNNITAKWDRFFLDTYTLSDTVVFEDFFNSANDNQNFVVPTTRLAPLAGYDWGGVYPLGNNTPIYYLYKDGTEFGDNTNLTASDWTISGTGTYGPLDSGAGLIATSADFNVVAAPGYIKLGIADLEASFFAGKLEGTYMEPNYFTPDTYIEEQATNQGTLNATLINGIASTVDADTTLFAAPRNDIKISSSVSADFTSLFRAGVIYKPTATPSADFIQTAAAKVNHTTTYSPSADFVTTATAGVTRKIAADITSDFSQTAQGNMIYDVGIAYAADWVRVEDDYVLPYYYLNFTADNSFLKCEATVEHIPYANLTAECDITGQPGYLQVLGSLTLSSDTEIINGSNMGALGNVTYAPGIDIASEFSQSALGGRIFRNVSPTLTVDTGFIILAGRDIFVYVPMDAAFSTNLNSDLFKGIFVDCGVTTTLTSLSGFGLFGNSTLSADFVVPSIRARIISIDEYYIDKVVKEIRNIAVFDEQRIAFIPIESKTLSIFNEDRINQVDYEKRYLRPELGVPIQVGQRNRRITA